MTVKTFRIDWYSQDAFIDFSKLPAVEIGVLMQIINLIYIYNGPIDNDPKFIGKSCDMGRKKCAGIIQSLINKKAIFLTSEGKIFKKRCEIELKKVSERREIYSRNGKIGAKTKWDKYKNQKVSNGDAISDEMASTSTRTSNKKTSNQNQVAYQVGGALNRFGNDLPSSRKGKRLYNIDDHLTDEARDRAKNAAPRHCQQYLMSLYNTWINEDQTPPDNPNIAYPIWCKKFTKEKPPI